MSNDHQTTDQTDEPCVDHDNDRAPTLATLARDRSLIAGIYETCDLWCMYCPTTDRCLAFRCTTVNEDRVVWDPSTLDGEHSGEGLMFLKALAEAEGRRAPPEIEAVLSGDREQQRRVFTLNDPVEHAGRDYMLLAEAYLKSRADFPPEITWRAAGPTPLEVLTWYHVLAPARVFRAILCAAEAREGVKRRHRDALASAKLALIGIDRSLSALAAISAEDDDLRLEVLRDRLCSLRDAVENRFRDARTFARPGLDQPADARESMRRFGFLWRRLRDIPALLHWRHERSTVSATPSNVSGSRRGAGTPRG